MKTGKFIALEGGEGAGKSTQAKLLADALKERGIPVITTREPGGSANAEKIRTLLLDTEGDGWNLRAEALLFAAARSDHIEKCIRPALSSGTWVICDRFLDSSRAYQGGGGGLPDEDILALHTIGSDVLMPDLTLLIEVSPEVSLRRTTERDAGTADRIGGRDAAYHARVAKAFEDFAESAPDRFVRINGNGSVEQTHGLILDGLSSMLDAQT